MNRRDAFKLLTALPMMTLRPGSETAAVVITKANYMIFVDSRSVDVDAMQECVNEMTDLFPDSNIALVAVRLRPGQTMEEAVKIYRVGDTDGHQPLYASSERTDESKRHEG